MDYQQNRKNATPQQQPAAGGFGAPATSGFGQPAQSTSTFGQQPATSTFGAKPATGLFGAPAATGSTGFGQSSGGFGQAAPTGGLFGQPQQPASTGFGQTNTTGGGLFGQPAQPAQPATGGGLFGNTSTGFGAQQNQQQPAATSTFGSFGQAKPATTGFGTSSGGFGSGTTSTFGQQPAASTSTFGGFGQAQQNQQQPAANGGLFGGGGGFGKYHLRPCWFLVTNMVKVNPLSSNLRKTLEVVCSASQPNSPLNRLLEDCSVTLRPSPEEVSLVPPVLEQLPQPEAHHSVSRLP